jgi:hypothetical protein
VDQPTEPITPTYPPAEWRLRRLTQLQRRPLAQRPVWRRDKDLDPFGGKDRVERGGELRVAIADRTEAAR